MKVNSPVISVTGDIYLQGMEIKPRHIWIIGVGLWLIAVVSAKIWPPKQSYLEWQHGYNMELMLLHSDVHRAELLNK